MPPEEGNTPEEKVPAGPKPGEILHDGKIYTAKELANLLERETQLQAGFTQKTQALAVQRDAVRKEADELRAERERVAELTRLFNADLQFYKTHDKDEWGDYVPQSLAMAKDMGIDVMVDPAASGVMKEISSLKDQIAQLTVALSNKGTEVSAEADLDRVIKDAKEIAVEFPLADKETLSDKIRLYIHTEGKGPTRELISEWAEAYQTRAIRLGAKLPGKEVPHSNGGSRTPQSPPHTPEIEAPALFDRKAMREATARWRAARREQNA